MTFQGFPQGNQMNGRGGGWLGGGGRQWGYGPQVCPSCLSRGVLVGHAVYSCPRCGRPFCSDCAAGPWRRHCPQCGAHGVPL